LALWYYLLKGRPHGPVTLDEVKREISSSAIGSDDLLYKESDTVWRMANTFEELGAAFKKSQDQEANRKDAKEWVLLLRKETGGGYKQRGPYSRIDIQKMLKSGEINYTDHAWRKGLKEWYKIISIAEFREDAEGPGGKPKIPESTVSESTIPQSTVKMGSPEDEVVSPSQDLSEITMKLPMPVDADEPTRVTSASSKRHKEENDDDIAESDSEIIRKIRRGLNSGNAVTEVADESKKSFATRVTPVMSRRINLWAYYLDLTPVKRAVFTGGALFVFLGAIFVFTYVSTYFDRQKLAFERRKVDPRELIIVPEEEVAPTPPDSDVVKSNEESAKEVVKVEERVSPTYLNIIKVNEDKPTALLKISTNGSSHYPIELKITASGGDVLGFMSYCKKNILRKGDSRDVSIKSLGLPPGKFRIKASIGTLSAATTFDFENDSADFNKRMSYQRKKYVYFHNLERFQFIRLSSSLEKETVRLSQGVGSGFNLGSWNNFYRGWKKDFRRIQSKYMDTAKATTSGNYIYTEM